MDVDGTIVDAIADEVSTNVDVFHLGMRVGVVCASNSSEVVAVKACGPRLHEAELAEQGLEPDDLSSAMSACDVLSFTSR